MGHEIREATINDIEKFNDKLRNVPSNKEVESGLMQTRYDRIEYLCSTNKTNPSLVSARDVLEVLSHYVFEIRIENMEKSKIEKVKEDSEEGPEEDPNEKRRIANDIENDTNSLRYLETTFKIRVECNFEDLIHILSSKVPKGVDISSSENDRNTNKTNPSLVSARDVLEVLSHFVFEIRIENMEKSKIEKLKEDSEEAAEEDPSEKRKIANDIENDTKNLRYLETRFNIRLKGNFEDLIHIFAYKVPKILNIGSSFVSKIFEIAKEFKTQSKLENIVKILRALNIKMLIYDQVRPILSIINDHLTGEPMKLWCWKGCCPLPIETNEENVFFEITSKNQLITECNERRTKHIEEPEHISNEYVKEILNDDGLLVETEVLSIIAPYHLVSRSRKGKVSTAKKVREFLEKIGHGPGKHKSHIFPYCYGGTNNHRNITSVIKNINLSAMKKDEGKIKKKFEKVQIDHGKDIYALDLSRIIYEIRENKSLALRKERVTRYLDTNHNILATDREQVSLISQN